MSTYSPSPMTAAQASAEESKRLAKERNKAIEKAQVYSRLIGNNDFAVFIAELRKALTINVTPTCPLSDYEQGRRSAWDVVTRELNYSQGAAEFISGMVAKDLELLHSQMFHMKQKGNEG